MMNIERTITERQIEAVTNYHNHVVAKMSESGAKTRFKSAKNLMNKEYMTFVLGAENNGFLRKPHPVSLSEAGTHVKTNEGGIRTALLEGAALVLFFAGIYAVFVLLDAIMGA